MSCYPSSDSGYRFTKKKKLLSARTARAVRWKKLSPDPFERLGLSTHAGKKSVKNRPQICPKYLFKNLRGMLPISLKL